MDLMQIFAARRGGNADSDAQPLRSNEHDEQLVADGLPRFTELTRRGRGWAVQTATPFAPIVALPTTLAKLELKNNHASMSMVVEGIWSWQLLGTAVVWSHTPWAQVGAPVVSAVAALLVADNKGGAATSAAGSPIVPAVDQTVVANGWRAFRGSTMNFGLAAATPGGLCYGEVDGALIVPPGKSLHVCVSGSVATASSMHCGAAGFWANITNE